MKLLERIVGNLAVCFASCAICEYLAVVWYPCLLEVLANNEVGGNLVDTMRNILDKESRGLENGPYDSMVP
jgi:predicted Na+-dependent transporter